MPRATPVRSRKEDLPRNADSSTMTAERRTWLTHWKEQAVELLPASTPLDIKVAVRRAVETALAALGPDDAVAEIQDLVGAIVEECTDELIEATHAEARDTRKQQLLQSVDLWIDDATLKSFAPKEQGALR
jgi:hypothetical protein